MGHRWERALGGGQDRRTEMRRARGACIKNYGDGVWRTAFAEFTEFDVLRYRIPVRCGQDRGC